MALRSVFYIYIYSGGNYTTVTGPGTTNKAFGISGSGHQVIRSSGHQVIRSSGHQVIRSALAVRSMALQRAFTRRSMSYPEYLTLTWWPNFF